MFIALPSEPKANLKPIRPTSHAVTLYLLFILAEVVVIRHGIRRCVRRSPKSPLPPRAKCQRWESPRYRCSTGWHFQGNDGRRGDGRLRLPLSVPGFRVPIVTRGAYLIGVSPFFAGLTRGFADEKGADLGIYGGSAPPLWLSQVVVAPSHCAVLSEMEDFHCG